jgi:cytochrome c-type biogenesis protein
VDPLATIAPDPLGVLVAFGAGILSFLSPCVLPLVPGYVSMVSGLSAAELTALSRARSAQVPAAVGAPVPVAVGVAVGAGVGTGIGTAPGAHDARSGGTSRTVGTSGTVGAESAAGAPVAVSMRPMVRGILLFIAGFTVVFVALGATASGIGHLLVSHKETLTHVSGFVVILLGLVLLLGTAPTTLWARLGAGPLGVLTRINGERRFDVRPSTLGTWAAPVMGMAFAFAWTPCLGPVLAVVLGLAEHNGSLAGGVLLLFAYSLGLAVPFLLAGVAFGRITSAIARARRGLWIVEAVGGVVLVVFGVLLVTDHLGWISAQFGTLLDHIGLSRLSTS